MVSASRGAVFVVAVVVSVAAGAFVSVARFVFIVLVAGAVVPRRVVMTVTMAPALAILPRN